MSYPRVLLLVFFGGCWFAVALWHVFTSSGSVVGEAMACWLLATLFLAIKLKAQPPSYFPQSWRDAAAIRSPANDS